MSSKDIQWLIDEVNIEYEHIGFSPFIGFVTNKQPMPVLSPLLSRLESDG